LNTHPPPDPELVEFLHRARLGIGEVPRFERLPGGVSSDIWLVHPATRSRSCMKRAASRLHVAAEWLAPVERNASEVAWLQQVAPVESGYRSGSISC
jgi:hypothetical protein